MLLYLWLACRSSFALKRAAGHELRWHDRPSPRARPQLDKLVFDGRVDRVVQLPPSPALQQTWEGGGLVRQ